jgi:hypothetical protein
MEDNANEIYNDNYPKPLTIRGTKKILHQMENNVCKIYKNNGGIGSGFFVNIPYENNIIPVMMTNYHVLNENYLKENEEIKITLNNDEKIITIKLNEDRRILCNKEYDTSIIEIKPEKDKIKDFMELDENIFKEDSNILYNRKSIYIIHYPNSEEVKVSYAIINNVEEYNISHYCCVEAGSSGSPIINLLNNKIIGIHKNGNSRFKVNYGTYLKYPINDFINQFIKNNIIINNDNLINNSYKEITMKKRQKKQEEKHKKEKKNINKKISHLFI